MRKILAATGETDDVAEAAASVGETGSHPLPAALAPLPPQVPAVALRVEPPIRAAELEAEPLNFPIVVALVAGGSLARGGAEESYKLVIMGNSDTGKTKLMKVMVGENAHDNSIWRCYKELLLQQSKGRLQRIY